jgi:hypothetical protein
MISDEMAATSSGCPNDTDHPFVSVNTARINPRKRANFTLHLREAGKWRRLTFRSPLSQGEEYWKLRQISLFEGMGMEPDDLLCPRNARPEKALVDARSGRSTAPIPEEITSELGRAIVLNLTGKKKAIWL